MWLWWIISLVILLASIIFSLYIFFSSYKPSQYKKAGSSKSAMSILQKPLMFGIQKYNTSLKLNDEENNSQLYFNELNKLQQRIQSLEKNKVAKTTIEDENWEELYYEVHEAKEKMENELDLTTQKLEETESLVNELKIKQSAWKEKQSQLENELNKAQSLQNIIGGLQRELEGAAERESELQQQLFQQRDLYANFELLQQQYASVQSDADELRNRITEINNRDVLLQQKISRLTELESTIETAEYEKMDLRKSVEDIILENTALATKLQELQEKLNTEKYA